VSFEKLPNPTPTPPPSTNILQHNCKIGVDKKNTTNTKVINLFETINNYCIFDSSNLSLNRLKLKSQLMQLSLSEIKIFMDQIRQESKTAAFRDALLNINPIVKGRDSLKQHIKELLDSGKMDIFAEMLTYLEYTSPAVGTFCSGTTVNIYDYSQVDISVTIHESCHGFNDIHGVKGVNGWNEGICITLPKY